MSWEKNIFCPEQKCLLIKRMGRDFLEFEKKFDLSNTKIVLSKQTIEALEEKPELFSNV